MTSELTSLLWVTALTSVMWIPYILNMIVVRGLSDAVGYPSDPVPLSPWAQKMKAAHANAAENLVVFAALVLVAHVAKVSNEATVLAAQVYLWARVAHFVSYSLAIPWLRTITFLIGFGCQATFILQLV